MLFHIHTFTKLHKEMVWVLNVLRLIKVVLTDYKLITKFLIKLILLLMFSIKIFINYNQKLKIILLIIKLICILFLK